MKRRLSPEEMFPASETGYRVRYVEINDGTRVRVVERGMEDDPPVLLLHGWGCSAYAFHQNIPALASQGRRVITPDLKGHGLSDKPTDESNYSTKRMVEHVSSIADALHLNRFAIAGHSMGAALALRFAIAKPDRISALGLISPVGIFGIPLLSITRILTPRWSIPVWRLLNTRWMTRLFLWIAYGGGCAPNEKEIDEYWAPSQFPAFTTALRHLLHAWNWGPFYVGGLNTHNIPILVISGSRDHLCRRKTREHLRKALKCDPKVVIGAGHLVIAQAPAQVNAALLALLSRER